MAAKRVDHVARPHPWRFIFGDLAAAKEWEQLCAAFPAAADGAWVAITSNPTHTDQRQHQLKGRLAIGRYQGIELPQWQYEATGAGRVWYLVDASRRTLVMTHAGPGHPSETDRGKTRRR